MKSGAKDLRKSACSLAFLCSRSGRERQRERICGTQMIVESSLKLIPKLLAPFCPDLQGVEHDR